MSDWKEIEEFHKFIQEVSANDFDRSSAVEILPPEHNFEAFKKSNMEDAARHFIENEGQVDPIVVLANDAEQRVFEADDDETMRDLFNRMQREAQRMYATMTFVAMRLYAAHGALNINGLDGDEIRAAVARGDLSEHYAWYAEQRTPDGPHRVSGIWQILTLLPDEREALGEHTDGHPEVAPLFHQILA